MNVDKVMNKEVPVCRPYDAVDSALRKMLDKALETLPVVDRRGRLVGVVTAEAARTAIRRWSGASHAMAVETVMARRAPSCRPSDTLSDAETTLEHYGVNSIPVIDDEGHFLGLLCAEDAPFSAAALRAAAKKAVRGDLRAA
jgi:CBS domain-containing protein